VPLKKRPDALLALTGKFKKEFLSLSSSESDCFLHIAQHPGCTSIEIQTEFNFDQPHVSRVLAKLAEKNYIRRLNNPQQSRQKIYFLTANKGMRLLNSWIDRTCVDLISGPNLGLARVAHALEKSSSISTLISLKNLIENAIKNHHSDSRNNIISDNSIASTQNSNQKVQRFHRLLSESTKNLETNSKNALE
jgi:DNA-binding MarR family transcriptional regulator